MTLICIMESSRGDTDIYGKAFLAGVGSGISEGWTWMFNEGKFWKTWEMKVERCKARREYH